MGSVLRRTCLRSLTACSRGPGVRLGREAGGSGGKDHCPRLPFLGEGLRVGFGCCLGVTSRGLDRVGVIAYTVSTPPRWAG